jgi:hypothetical protein
MKRYTPTTIPNSTRQRVFTNDGVEFERRYIYLPAEVWDALRVLSIKSHRSTSQVIEALASIAAQVGNASNVKDTPNDAVISRIS